MAARLGVPVNLLVSTRGGSGMKAKKGLIAVRKGQTRIKNILKKLDMLVPRLVWQSLPKSYRDRQ